MTETLFERYKEALRAGHVAVVRGRLEAAAAAYGEAIAIAPDRAVPRTSLGMVRLRLGEPEAALDAYDAALALVPDDDPSILGRAQALVVLRRTGEAARAYDELADLRAEGGRLPEAAEAARRALAIEPSDARRERHASLVARVREASGDAVAAGAAALDERVAADDGAAAVDASGSGDVGGAAAAAAMISALPRPEALVEALEMAVARGDVETAATAALAAARAYRALGHVAAASDACLEGIGARPADVELHLFLADLAVDRGWVAQAAETYRNLLRLVELDGDVVLAASVRAAAARLPDAPPLPT